MSTLRNILLLIVLVAAPQLAVAQTSFPMITHTTPVAVQRGQTTEVTVSGRMNFFGTYKALFEGAGISAEVVPDKAKKDKDGKIPNVTTVKLKLTIAPDASLGVREYRLASSLGVSSIGQLIVVADPVVEESKDNDTPDKALKVELPSVLTGRLEKAEDVDFYQFTAKGGEHLTFEVQCARIQDKIHDLQKHAKPMVVLYDSEGRELAANDCFYFADPLLSYTIPSDGTYSLQIRESTYDGDARWVYAILATNAPYASHVFPMAGNPGKTIEVEPVGTALEFAKKVPVQLPSEPGIHLVPLTVDGKSTYPVTMIASELPQQIESEDNDTPETANKITLPCGINGRMDKSRDLDHFAFQAKKGQAVYFEVKARRFGTLLNSSIHAVLDVMDAKGNIKARNYDTHGSEASLVFTPSADGEYILRVRDLNSKDGPSYIYFVEAGPSRPDFTVVVDGDKAMIGPGSSTTWFYKLTRERGFTGPVAIEVKGLPKGITCSPLTIPESMTEGAMVLTAAKDAEQTVANVEIFATGTLKTADGKEQPVTKVVRANQEIYQPGGGRGLFEVSMQTVGVTEPSDILKVNLSTNKIELKPGQEVKIDITIDRNKDYDKAVSLDILLRHLNRVYGDPLPPGVKIVAGKSKTLLGKTSKGHIVLKADAKAAPIENVPVSVMAHVSINFVVKVSYSSEPLLITVRKE